VNKARRKKVIDNWPGNSKTSVADDNRVISGTCGPACQKRRRLRKQELEIRS
jgi:hypothetical protein